MNEAHLILNLQYKYFGTFANHKYEEFSYPQNRKCATPF